MYLVCLIQSPDRARAWAAGWRKEGSTGAKQIRDLAAKIKDIYHTNGVWNPDALVTYKILCEAADHAEQPHGEYQCQKTL